MRRKRLLTSREFRVMKEMKRLLEKYPNGIEGFERRLMPTVAGNVMPMVEVDETRGVRATLEA